MSLMDWYDASSTLGLQSAEHVVEYHQQTRWRIDMFKTQSIAVIVYLPQNAWDMWILT